MSILGSILTKVFGHHDAPSAPTTPAPTPASTAPVPPPAAPGEPAPTAPARTTVDVGAMLDGLAAKSGQTFDWRHSIVDMMKLLGLDSSLSARQALAAELHYTGDVHDSASMNVWLHRQVMTKVAENGGTVPDSLR